MTAAFERLSRAYAARLGGRSCAECIAPPVSTIKPLAWSAQGVVEHLILTYRITAGQCRKYRERGQSTTKKARWQETAARLLVVGCGYFPGGQPAPEFVTPGRSGLAPMEGEALAALFEEELIALDRELALCEQAFGKQPLAPHFRLGPLTAAQWRRFHVVHGRHHLAQLGRILHVPHTSRQTRGTPR